MISAERISKIFTEVAGAHVEGSKAKPEDGNIFRGVFPNREYVVDMAKMDTYRDEVKEMLLQLNSDFTSGWSFMQMPFDKSGVQWGEQSNAEELMILGMALGYIVFTFQDEKMWKGLPGHMPYVTIIFDKLVASN